VGARIEALRGGGRMKRLVCLLRAFWANSLALELEYRADFLISAVTAIISFGAGLLLLYVMFQQAETIGGWSFYQALTLYGVYLFLEEFAVDFLAVNVGELPLLIRRGDLDFVLLKPVNSQLFISLRRFVLTSLPALFLGLGVMLYGMWAMETMNIGPLALAFVFLACAMLIIYTIWTLLHTLAFWFVRIENISQVFYAFFEVARFPVSAYPGWLRAVFTFIVPVAFMTTVPAAAASNIIDWPLAIWAPIIALGGLWASHLFWQFALKHYTSASS
jgi:ABC-2 type transport system permease protein